MATTVQITGGAFQDPAGNPLANGVLVFTLSQDAQVNTEEIASGTTTTVPLDANGNIITSPAQMLWPNDVLSPANTFYTVAAYSAEGQLVWGPNAQQVLSTPSPYNIGAWVPGITNTLGAGNPFISSLTTSGTSGAATIQNGVLNIPEYTGSGTGAVSSVFGRTGAVVAATGDYTVAEVTGAAPLASPTFTGTVTAPTFSGALDGNATTATTASNATELNGAAVPVSAAIVGTNAASQLVAVTATTFVQTNSSVAQTVTVPLNAPLRLSGGPLDADQIGSPGFTTTGAGDWSFIGPVAFGSGAPATFTGGATSTDTLSAGTAMVATSTANANGSTLEWQGSAWTSTGGVGGVPGAVPDVWTAQNVLGTGTEPTSTLTFTHTGSSGAATVSVPALEITSAQPEIGFTPSGGGPTGLIQYTGAYQYNFPNGTVSATTVNAAVNGALNGPVGTVTPSTIAATTGTFSAGITTSVVGSPAGDSLSIGSGSGAAYSLLVHNPSNSVNVVIVDPTGNANFSGTVTAAQLSTTQTPTASTTASNYSVPIVLNGTTYYMRLSSTA